MNVAYSIHRNRLFIYHWKEAFRPVIAYTIQFSKVFTLTIPHWLVLIPKKSEVSRLSFLYVILNYWQRQSLYVTPSPLHNGGRLVILLVGCYVTSSFLRVAFKSLSFIFSPFVLVATGPIARTISRLRLSFVLRTCVGPLVSAVAAVLMKRLMQLMWYSRDE